MSRTTKPTIHLLSVAGSDREMATQLGLKRVAQIIDWVQDIIGPAYEVSGNPTLMNATIDETRGGRRDDARRAREIQSVLADEDLAAVVSLRGGSWLARVLPHVDFDVLTRRRAPLHVFGFSELTPLVNIAAGYRPTVRARYDLGPGYLLWGLRNYAARHFDQLTGSGTSGAPTREHRAGFARGWALANFANEFAAFFIDVADIISGRGSSRILRGTRVAGQLRPRQKIRIVGGCLSTLVTLLGSAHQPVLEASRCWLALEDVGEDIHRIDRYLAQLKMAGVLERCRGLLLGDFHHGAVDQTAAILQLLPFHLPNRPPPIVAHCNFGHCYPAAGVPLNQEVTLVREHQGKSDAVLLAVPS